MNFRWGGSGGGEAPPTNADSEGPASEGPDLEGPNFLKFKFPKSMISENPDFREIRTSGSTDFRKYKFGSLLYQFPVFSEILRYNIVPKDRRLRYCIVGVLGHCESM